jgi:hypothetical protein
MKEKEAAGEKEELSKERARDFSIRMDEELLDMDLEEQLANVRTFRDIVERQRMARQQLILLLIRSRCQFGSEEAASFFYKLEETSKQLKRRKDLISELLALEGVDLEADAAPAAGSDLKDLEPLSWYDAPEKPSDDAPEKPPESKKPKIDEL